MSTKVQVVLVSILVLLSFETLSQNLWELNKHQDGIKVYTKVEEGSAFKAFKAIVLVNASVDEIIEVLKNVDRYTEWYGYTKTSKLLKHENGVQYNYVETIFPWPYKNRDMVYRMAMNGGHPNAEHPEEVEISLVGIPDYLPEKKGIVRMKKAKGYILLQPLNDKTQVTYEFHSEPGDNVPTWLANSSIAELPFKTLFGLREILETSR